MFSMARRETDREKGNCSICFEHHVVNTVLRAMKKRHKSYLVINFCGYDEQISGFSVG